MKKFLKQKNTAFTLVETLVALSIFTVSVLALLVILTQGISDTGYAKKKILATYLNQEGVEYIRNIRDTFVLYSGGSQTGWNGLNTKLINASCQTNNGCYFDDQNLNYSNPSQPMAGITMNACGSSCPALLYEGTTGKYGYLSGINSGFIRKIQVVPISANETKVFSTIYWTQGSGGYNITFSESLFNWVE